MKNENEDKATYRTDEFGIPILEDIEEPGENSSQPDNPADIEIRQVLEELAPDLDDQQRLAIEQKIAALVDQHLQSIRGEIHDIILSELKTALSEAPAKPGRE